MSWAKLDDRFHSHPKVMATSLEALGLFTLALTYAASYETDGILTAAMVSALTRGRSDLPAELCASGLWERNESGFKIHDFLRYNPSKASLEKERKSARKRMKRLRGGSGDVRANGARTPGRAGTGSSSSSQRKGKGAGKGRGPRGLPLPMPEPFELTDARRAWAIKGGLHPEREWGHFKDYHRAKGSRWVDWDAAWRNWCRNEVKFEARGKA